MASIGLKVLAWAKMATESSAAIPTYEPGRIIGKIISTNITITNAEGELFADDMLAEYVSEFSSGTFAAETDNITLEDQAALYGATMVDGELQFNSGDNAPYGGIAGYQVLMVRGARRYRAWFFPKVRASIPNTTGATKAGSISFGTQPMNAKIMSPEYGPWYYLKEFTSEDAAKAYIESKLGIAEWFNVDVQVQGDGTAVPTGITSVESGGSIELTLSDTPTALYDNGVDNVAGIVGNKYAISNVAADHKVAIIF